MTKVVCVLQISRAAYDEIRQRIIDAGAIDLVRNGHVFMDEIAIEPLLDRTTTKHKYEPNEKYPWFCAYCGYAEHEKLKHL